MFQPASVYMLDSHGLGGPPFASKIAFSLPEVMRQYHIAGGRFRVALRFAGARWGQKGYKDE